MPLIAGDDIVYYCILKCLNFSVTDCYKGQCENTFPYMWFGIVEVWILFCPFLNTGWGMSL